MYDALRVNISDGLVECIMAANKSEANAEACCMMAIARRGLDEQFYPVAEHGKYKVGDIYQGR